jgi:uncharacterized protein (TIGR03382 family)
MRAHRGVVLAVALFTTACSVDATASARQAIIGGETSEPSEFMATGMIVTRERLICTGTLIAPDVVLTAAHCLKRPQYGEFGFTLDTDASDGIENVVPGAFVHQHPDFDDGVDEFVNLAVRNDIGILILERPVTEVAPEQIDQPELATAVGNGNELPMCGYGRVVWYTGTLALKRDATVVVDRTDAFEFSTTADDPQPCSGDSGAPLFVDGPTGRRIVGVVSRAMGRSEMCDTGAIITRVAPYAAWIAIASESRHDGCSAGGGGSILPVGAMLAFLTLRRRRTPR